MKAEQFTDVVTYHGEGPIWDAVAGVLRWVDMLNGDIVTLPPGGQLSRWHVGTIAAAMRPRAGGGLVVAVEHGFVLMDADGRLGPEQTAFTDPGSLTGELGHDLGPDAGGPAGDEHGPSGQARVPGEGVHGRLAH